MLVATAGCVYMPLGKMPKLSVANLANGTGTVELSTKVLSGSYLFPDSLSVQSVIDPYSQADIKRLTIKIFRLSGNTETPVLALDSGGAPLQVDLGGQDLTKPIRIKNLATFTTYRVRAFAYKADAGTDSDLINDVKTSSFVDIRTSDGDRTVAAELPVQLIAKFFDGQGASPLEVKSGIVRNTGAEVLEQ